MVYLSRCYRDCTSAGNKAKTDNEQTMDEMGFRNVGLPQRIGGNGIFIFFYDLVSVLKAVATTSTRRRACPSISRKEILLFSLPHGACKGCSCGSAHP